MSWCRMWRRALPPKLVQGRPGGGGQCVGARRPRELPPDRGGEARGWSKPSFDKTLAINSMQAWPDARAGLREIWRVLKHGGIVVLGFTVNSGQPKVGVVESLAAAGFAQAQIVDRSKLFFAIAAKP